MQTINETSARSIGDSETSRSVANSESASDEGQLNNVASESPPGL